MSKILAYLAYSAKILKMITKAQRSRSAINLVWGLTNRIYLAKNHTKRQ